jgi:hypothetical protein
MRVRYCGPVAALLIGCVLLLLPGISWAEHTKLFCQSSSGTLKAAVSGTCPAGTTRLPLVVADSVSAVRATAEIDANGNVIQQDKVNGSDWITDAGVDATGSYIIFFRNGLFNNQVNCVATNVAPSPTSVAPISSLQITNKGVGGMVINSVGANGLVPIAFDLVCSGN